MVKYKIEWADKAVHDLKNILNYYKKRNFNNYYSRKLFSRIMKYVDVLSENPLLGVKSDYKNVRSLIIENFQIIYEIKDDFILISMIWDSRRNPNEKF